MHITLVDPSRTVLKSVSRMLEAHGHRVSAFRDGPAAIEHIKNHDDIDAMITSVEFPSTSGLELCWEARLLASAGRPLYVILMSSDHETHTLGEALDSGADDFISKPPKKEELCARLRAGERLIASQAKLILLATTDSLTGLLNRRAFFAKAEVACNRAETSEALSAVMLDIDHFKRINDTYGHDVGDIVIRAVADQLDEGGGVAGRLGGEEFALILEGCTRAATAHAEHLRARIAALRFEVPGAELIVTCSLGVSGHQPGDSVDALLKRADVSLYAAKTGGRNRVVTDGCAPSPPDGDRRNSVIRSRDRAGQSLMPALVNAAAE